MQCSSEMHRWKRSTWGRCMAMTHERLAVSSGLHTILTNYRFSGSPNLQNPQPTTSLLDNLQSKESVSLRDYHVDDVWTWELGNWEGRMVGSPAVRIWLRLEGGCCARKAGPWRPVVILLRSKDGGDAPRGATVLDLLDSRTLGLFSWPLDL